MELNSATLSDFTKLATVLWLKGADSLPMVARRSGIFQETPVPMYTGNSREFSEIDLELFASNKDEGDQAERARIQQGYSKTMTMKRISKDIGITYEMRTQNKYPEVIAVLTNLAQLAYNRMEVDLQHRIGFGASTSYTDKDGDSISITVGDGLALFSTVHTLRGSATTYRNILANNPVISKGALEGMEQLCVEQSYNQFGEKVTMPYDILWTTDDPNTVNTAREYLQSSADVSGAHSGITNVYASKYRHVVLPYVATTNLGVSDSAKRKYWGLVSSMYSTGKLGIWEEPRLKVPNELNAGEDFATDNWNFGVRAGYGICFVSGRGIKLSKGDGTV